MSNNYVNKITVNAIGLLTNRLMGNLDLNASSTRSPYSRRPIFNRDNSVQYQAASHSLSPYLAKTPKSNMYRSSVNHNNYLRYSKINQSKQKNRVYISPKMIQSVIKDSANSQPRLSPVIVKQNNTKGLFQRNPYRNNADRTPKIAKNNLYPQKYFEKPFQSSPTKAKIINSNYQKLNVNTASQTKQNMEEDTFKQQSFNRNQIPQQFTLSTITNKSPLSLSKIAKSGENSGRHYQIQGNYLLSPHKCCCHNQVSVPEQIKQSFSIDNAPTERKKPVRSFKPFIAIHQNEMRKQKKLKIDVSENSDSQTIRAIKQSKLQSSNIHRQNRQKCQQIIKRVRNFNQFLNEIKKKLKKEADIASSQNNTISNMSINEQSVNQPSFNTSLDQHSNSIGTDYNEKINNHKKSITMALKLENQKIQLEKYRKMVERELSKQHSIQSIQIQGGRNKQKIITISFQNKIVKHTEFKKVQNSSSGIQDSNKSQKIQHQTNLTQKNNNEDKSVNSRVNKISKLMHKLQGMQNKLENQNYRQIQEVLQKEYEQMEEDQ